jgi:hypothetical protein
MALYATPEDSLEWWGEVCGAAGGKGGCGEGDGEGGICGEVSGDGNTRCADSEAV